MSFRSSLLAASLSATALAVPLVTEPHHAPKLLSTVGLAPLFDSERAINSSYIVVLKDDAHPSLVQNHLNLLQSQSYGAESSGGLLGELTAGVRHVFSHNLNGYAGVFSEEMVEQLRGFPEVEYVERDQVVHTMTETQKSAPWVSVLRYVSV
jgi:cerevisin